MTFFRYVALGDSSTEGLEDPLPDGTYRGWADRLAELVARAQGDGSAIAPALEYANLAVRGRKTREILIEQLEPALRLGPDLATLFSGTNDVIRPAFDLAAVTRDIETMQRALREAGATVLTITLPDLSPVMPIARRIAPRVLALNDAVRSVSARTGTIVVDLERYPVAVDPRLWADDRLHANSTGHARIAAALAHALDLPGSDRSWSEPLPTPYAPGFGARIGAEVRWTRTFLLPWLWRRVRGRSSGDGISAKRPRLLPVSPTTT